MEHYFLCPYCGQHISMVLDTSVRSQTYIEDCEVCCKPIRIRYVLHGDDVAQFAADTLGA